MKEDDEEKSRAKLAGLLLELKNQMQSPIYQERNLLIARDAYARYQAYVASGFTAEQALNLVAQR
jgi:hypothetical protein